MGRPKIWSGIWYWRYRPYEYHPDGRFRKGKNELAVRCHTSGQPYVRLKVDASNTTPDVDPAHLVAIASLDRPVQLVDVDSRPIACPRPKGYLLVHKNGRSDDWRVENLEWVKDPDSVFDFYKDLMEQTPVCRREGDDKPAPLPGRDQRRPVRVYG